MTFPVRHLIAASVACALLAGAAHSRDERLPGSRYTSVREMALGDADLAIADDGASGIFDNPSGIAKVRGPRVEPINLMFSGGAGLFGVGGMDVYKFTSLSSFAPKLVASPDSTVSGGLSFAPTFSTRGAAIGALLQNSFIARGNADGTITYRSRYEFIPGAGFALRVAGGMIRLGYSLQWVNKSEGDVTTPVGADLGSLGWNQGLRQGSGFSHTAGFALTMPTTYLPTASIVARNVLGTRYGSFNLLGMASNPVGVPDEEEMTVDAGFAISPRLARGNILSFTFAYRDLLSQTAFPWYGKLAGGMEINLSERFYLRLGWGSGYPSAGIALRGKTGEFGFTWSSDELGDSYHAWQNTRFSMQYQIRAF